MTLSASLRLMRFHKPAGTLLLWCPTAWALWVANQGMPEMHLLVYFFMGTVLMRAAGCVLNDMADRHIDKHVHRTQKRPLTTGEIGLVEAFGWLIVLLLAAFWVLIQLPRACFYYALFALFITVVYPFCKRFFAAPQLILGLAFSMGIPMAYAASSVAPNVAMLILLCINFAWIVAYDTMYAMADKADDLRLSVQSTAVLLGDYECWVIGALQLFFHGLWLVLAVFEQYSVGFYGVWCVAGGVLVYQQLLIRSRDANLCLRAFSMSSGYGALMWLGLMIAPVL